MTDFAILIVVFVIGFFCGALVINSANNDQAEKGFYMGGGKVYAVKQVDMKQIAEDLHGKGD